MYLISCGPPIPETSVGHFIQAQIYGVRRIGSLRNCRTKEVYQRQSPRQKNVLDFAPQTMSNDHFIGARRT
jgi:hypothetical protein